MKLSLLLPAALLAIGASAVASPQKAVLVTYPDNNTPDSVVNRAMDAIKNAGGTITHQYTLFKGFAANAPATILESVQAWGNEYHATIEDDQTVQANSGSIV